MKFILTRAIAALHDPRQGEDNRPKFRSRGWLILAVLGFSATGIPASAVNREVSITAPVSAVAGSKVTCLVGASTDAGAGERVGFFHADYSTDSGKTWTAISYATNEDVKTTRSVTFKAGTAGSKAIIRVRVAFRGGKDGDVDYNGKKIEWQTTWNNWATPPAKMFTIRIVAP